MNESWLVCWLSIGRAGVANDFLYPKKSPTYPPKSPMYLQKTPVYLQKSPTYLKKSPTFPPKSPMHPQASPYTKRSSLSQFEILRSLPLPPVSQQKTPEYPKCCKTCMYVNRSIYSHKCLSWTHIYTEPMHAISRTHFVMIPTYTLSLSFMYLWICVTHTYTEPVYPTSRTQSTELHELTLSFKCAESCTHTATLSHTQTCEPINPPTHTHQHTCVRTRTFKYMIYIYSYMCVRVRVYIYVYMYTYNYIYIYIYMYMCTCIYRCVYVCVSV